MKTSHLNGRGRREFLTTIGKLAAASLVMAPPVVSLGEGLWKPRALTVQQVIDIILKEIPNPRTENTVDKIRSGTPDQEVAGIVTTMFPTIEVIKKTKRAGANFIIA